MEEPGIIRIITRGKDLIKKILAGLPGLRTNPVFNYIVLALLAIGVGVLSLLLGAVFFGLPMFRAYFSSFIVISLNLLPVVLPVFLLYFISRRAWVAFTFPSLFVLSISVIHFFKVQLRGDPLVASDYRYIFEAGTILSSYSPTINWKIYLTAAALLCGILISVFILKYKPGGAPLRIIAPATIVAVSVVLYVFLYTNTELYDSISGDTKTTEWSPNRNYIAKGFLYPLIHGARDSLAEMNARYPAWYDEHEAQEVFESYADADIPDDKKVNIICIMLEAYADLSLFDLLDFTEDVYGPLHRLQEEAYSGKLITNVYAGGTIDTERLFLTGNLHLTSFTSATNSYVRYLRSQGYYTEGAHAGDVWFYDREPINANLGFERYVFLGDFELGPRYDLFFFQAMMDMYMERDRNTPYFSFHLTYQNHGSYDNTGTQEPYVITQGNLSDESWYILNNYLYGIYDTGRHIENFIDALRPDPDPVVVLLCSDHMPWLGNAQSVYDELGIVIDPVTDDWLYDYYSTPYIIWANDAAKQTLGNDFSGDGGSFSPGFLMGELFSLCSWEGEGYMQALRELRERIDVVHTATLLYRENGVLTPELSPEGREAYKKMRMIALYRLNNFRY